MEKIKNDPKICIGMFLYNEEKHLARAIESLLGQTYGDFRLIVWNDCSSDSTKDIVLRYAAVDKRISYFENRERMGYATNYQMTFGQADADTTYYAWAAGHDVHHSHWLETLVGVLVNHPEVVMAYPLTRRIGDNDENLNVPSLVFDTFGLDVKERIEALFKHGVGYGNMIYGLFRADALRKIGIFHKLLLPDVVLLWELALFGSFKQVNEELWFRRYYGLFSVERQRRNVFGRIPWYAYFPYPVVNTVFLFWNCFLRPGFNGFNKRHFGLYLAILYMLKFGFTPTISRIPLVRGLYQIAKSRVI